MRIMRKENWLVALISNDVLPLSATVPLVGSRPLLPQTLEWSLYTTLVGASPSPNSPGQPHTGSRGNFTLHLTFI
jgi:hypothetical protein